MPVLCLVLGGVENEEDDVEEQLDEDVSGGSSEEI